MVKEHPCDLNLGVTRDGQLGKLLHLLHPPQLPYKAHKMVRAGPWGRTHGTMVESSHLGQYISHIYLTISPMRFLKACEDCWVLFPKLHNQEVWGSSEYLSTHCPYTIASLSGHGSQPCWCFRFPRERLNTGQCLDSELAGSGGP